MSEKKSPSFRPRFNITWYNRRVWRNTICMGVTDILDGVVRLGTLGLVSSNFSTNLIGWLTWRDIQKNIKARSS